MAEGSPPATEDPQPKTNNTEEDTGYHRHSKIFNDPVHGQMKLHPLLVRIINTPEFERLRFIKQLGGVYFVYPGAAHNRFEHSIGVCHLAGQLARKLHKNQPGLGITREDILCVEIAALCHDLGHGPFSHLFDQMVIPKICSKGKWKTHEEISVEVFECIWKNLEEDFKKAGLNTSEDKLFIKELINGPLKEEGKGKYTGRPDEQHFLYEIVSNKDTGIDVDKWDYFARDCLMLGMKSHFSHERAIEFARVIKVNGKTSICFRDKVARPLYNMFSVRDMIHRDACYHRVTTVVQIMIADAIIIAANSNHDDFKFRGKDGELLTISKAVEKMDMVAYLQITDEILMKIYHAKISKRQNKTPQDLELEKAQNLAKRVLNRDLYKFVGFKLFTGDDILMTKTMNEPANESYQEMVKKKVKSDMDNIVDNLKKEDKIKDAIVVYPVIFNFGKGKEDPLKKVWFYRKDDINKPIKLRQEEISNFLPKVFQEIQVLVYCNDTDLVQDVKEVFTEWKAKQ